MLCLKIPSQPQWVEVAKTNLEKVLIDHAHCEKKAAINAIALLNRYPDKSGLVQEMIELAQEELEHFALVNDYIVKRGFVLKRDEGDRYAQRLHELIRKQEPYRMLDSLLVAAIIEARSCERFSILSEAVPDEELRGFYKSLLASEAGHYRIFCEIAEQHFDEKEVRQRLDEMCEKEAEIILSLESNPTVHG